MKLEFPEDSEPGAPRAPEDQGPRTQNGGQAPQGAQEEGAGGSGKRPRRPFGPLRLLGLLLRWTLGLVLALGLIGAAAGYFLYNWVSNDLPDLERVTEFRAPQATTILARDGSVLGLLYHEKRFVISLDDMPKYLPMAFLAIEDSSFYQHPGINPLAIVRAFLVNFERGTKSQGGSTITQQIVKQLLLSSERSYLRKMKEAILATRLEQSLSKDQILALYLNYIYLGQHAYGVEAAARTYFGKHASNITLAEACVIAGMPQAPSRYNPFRNPDAARNRQREVLQRLRTLQWISEEEYRQAVDEPLVYWSAPDSVPGPAQWYFEEARRLLVEFFTEKNLAALGVNTRVYGEDYVYEAGLTVRTAMDPLQQSLAGQALREGLEALDKRQGWRDPVTRLESRAEREAFLERKAFEPSELLGGQWTQALVTGATAQELRVALGSGYVGRVSAENFAWARHRSSLAPQARAKGLASEGDVVWVSLAPERPREKKRPAKGKRGQEPEPAESAPAQPAPGLPMELALQQEPLVQGALVSIEPDTGDVVALIGGYQFGNTHFNRATQARRQPGSSFKPVVYSTALDNGFTPLSTVLDAPIEYVIPATGEVWRPSNFEKNYRGEMPLHQALALSRNTPTVRLAQAVGISKVIDRAKMLGLEPNFPNVLAVCLGSVGVSPLNLTQAYASFANGGLGVRPRIITSIVDSRGRELYRQDVEHWQAVSPQNAYQMEMLLKRVVESGTGARARLEGRSVAGKTGTSNDSRDCWFVGFTPYLCTGVYVGYDQMTSLGRQEQGGRTAAPIFKAYREKADQAYDDRPQDFPAPPGVVMVDGLPFQSGSTDPGLSATDGMLPGSGEEGEGSMPVDEGEDSESLMRQMF